MNVECEENRSRRGSGRISLVSTSTGRSCWSQSCRKLWRRRRAVRKRTCMGSGSMHVCWADNGEGGLQRLHDDAFMCAWNARAFLWVTYVCFPLKKKAKRRRYKKCSDIHLVYCGATWSNWDNGHLLVLQTGYGHDDKFVLRSFASRQAALMNTEQTLASASNLHLADRDGRVSLGLSDTSDGKLAESWSEVINRFDEDRSKLRLSTPRMLRQLDCQ